MMWACTVTVVRTLSIRSTDVNRVHAQVIHQPNRWFSIFTWLRSSRRSAHRTTNAMKIFICYRRIDVPDFAHRLAERLGKTPGVEVFIDEVSIPYGEDYREVIHSRLLAADAIVAVVGPRWLSDEQDHSKQASYADDLYVTFEIAYALEHGIPIVPVLFGDAKLDRQRLPSTIIELASKKAVHFGTPGSSFEPSTQVLHTALMSLVEAPSNIPSAPAARPRFPLLLTLMALALSVFVLSVGIDDGTFEELPQAMPPGDASTAPPPHQPLRLLEYKKNREDTEGIATAVDSLADDATRARECKRFFEWLLLRDLSEAERLLSVCWSGLERAEKQQEIDLELIKRK